MTSLGTWPQPAAGAQGLSETIVRRASDVALVLDAADRVVRLVTGAERLAAAGCEARPGMAFADLVRAGAPACLREMLRRARAGGDPRPCDIRHGGEEGDALLVRYSAVPAGGEGELLLLGRDLTEDAALEARVTALIRALEADAERRNRAEAHYRMLFSIAARPIAILSAGTGAVQEASPAAARMLGRVPDELPGRAFAELVAPEDRAALAALLAAAEVGEAPPPAELRLAEARARIRATASAFDAPGQGRVMLALAEVGEDAVRPRLHRAPLLDLLDRVGDAVLLTDEEGGIVWANRAAAALAALAGPAELRGTDLAARLGGWDVPPGEVFETARRHGRHRHVRAVLSRDDGGERTVSLAVIAMPEGAPAGFGIVMRPTGAAAGEQPGPPCAEMPGDTADLAALIGNAPLKEIVRGCADPLERACIETALRLSRGNRAAAAAILGLSRQSLHSKLRHHGIG